MKLITIQNLNNSHLSFVYCCLIILCLRGNCLFWFAFEVYSQIKLFGQSGSHWNQKFGKYCDRINTLYIHGHFIFEPIEKIKVMLSSL